MKTWVEYFEMFLTVMSMDEKVVKSNFEKLNSTFKNPFVLSRTLIIDQNFFLILLLFYPNQFASTDVLSSRSDYQISLFVPQSCASSEEGKQAGGKN